MKWKDEKIFLKLTGISEEKDIKLTMDQKIFFIRLMDYSMKDGSEYPDRFSIMTTLEDMAQIFGLSMRMVQNSLKAFEKCGLIERVPVERGEPVYGVKTNIYKSVIKELGYL